MKTNEKIFLSFFLFIFLIPAVIAATTITTTTTTGPLSESTGSLNVNQMTGNVILPGNVTYALGHVCTVNYECYSGYCVDGYCCNSACDGSCNRCDVSASLGTCTDVNSLCLGTVNSCSCSGGSCQTCSGTCTNHICYLPGGGGGGYPYSTTTTTPAPAGETETISPISNGTSATFNFTSSDTLKIISINVQVNNSATDAHITIAETSLPAGANAAIGADGIVYKYLQITTNIPNSEITQIKIKFKIEKSWLTANGIDVASITLKRYVDGSWVSLPTVKLSEDATYVYFEATSPGLSLFAITGQKIVTSSSTTSSSATTSTTSTIVPISPGSPTMWLAVFLVLIVVVVIIIGLKQKAIMKHVMPTKFLHLIF